MKIEELNRYDIRRSVDSITKNKSKQISNARYLGITEDFIVIFQVASASGNGHYIVLIKFDELSDIIDDDNLSTNEKVRLALEGDIKISCTCPAFKFFGYQYILSQLDAVASSEEHRYPKIRNPHLQGILCKHSYFALERLPMLHSRISKDIDNRRFYKI